MRDFKEEVRKNSKDTNRILEGLCTLMIKKMANKGKEVGISCEEEETQQKIKLLNLFVFI